MIVRQPLKQRADYTHKYNLKTGRHGWLRLTPAYSVKIVEELIGEYRQPMRVLDPFCGTATTGLSAANHGHDAVMIEINPFLVWLGHSKTARYAHKTIRTARAVGTAALGLIRTRKVEPAPAPPLHNIERWWDTSALLFMRQLRAAVELLAERATAERDLLDVAFCRTLIKLSNSAFNHQSMSFRDPAQGKLFCVDHGAVFDDDLSFVLAGAGESPAGTCEVVSGDARSLYNTAGRFNLVITSPPYANRMSYIRELRPYMYWLGYLGNGREAGEMDWLAIGGTWGCATSRLIAWRPKTSGYENDQLARILARIGSTENANGPLLANYVAKYFEDIWEHLSALPKVLATNAELHYIVGNSTFYGVILPVEQLYADMLQRLGFGVVRVRPIRKRNSKRELIEFEVSARWSG